MTPTFLRSMAEVHSKDLPECADALRQAADALDAAHMKMLFHKADAKVANERAEAAEARAERYCRMLGWYANLRIEAIVQVTGGMCTVPGKLDLGAHARAALADEGL